VGNVTTHDLPLLFGRHLAVQQRMVLGYLDMHHLKGRIAAGADAVSAESLDRLEDGTRPHYAAD
jgi:hypothetical protein